MAGSKKKAAIALTPDEVATLAQRVADECRREGMVLLSKLASLGVGKDAKPLVLDALTALDGIEVGKRALRIPVNAQLAERLDAGAALPLKSIASAAVAATKKEITDAVDALVAAGEARLIVRGTELVVVGRSTTDVLAPSDVDRLERTLSDLTKSIKLAQKKKAGLLAADVSDVLASFARGTNGAAKRAPSLDDVLGSVERHRESASGLTFVPTLVRALGDREAVHAALLSAANQGVLELRPESGMGRLSADEEMLCLPGPQGSRLSWVRRVSA